MSRHRSANLGQPSASATSAAPRRVTDEKGHVVEVILGYEDYRGLLRLLAQHADWDSLPPSIQDAIDNFLADEALAEEGLAIPLRQALAETGDLPS